MSVSAVAPGAAGVPTSAPSTSSIQDLQKKIQKVQKQITDLSKDTKTDPKTKTKQLNLYQAQLTAYQAQLAQLQKAHAQSGQQAKVALAATPGADADGDKDGTAKGVMEPPKGDANRYVNRKA